MNKDWIKNRNKLSPEYAEGVKQFVEAAKSHVNSVNLTRCPCKQCMNSLWQTIKDVETHLFIYGIAQSYTQWVYHGEPVNLPRYEHQSVRPEPVERVNLAESSGHNDDDEIMEMLNDMTRREFESIIDEEEGRNNDETVPPNSVEGNDRSTSFDDLMKEASIPLYPGCTRFTAFHFLVKLMHIKALNKWTNTAFDMLLKVLIRSHPDGACIPGSFYEANKKFRELGLTYESIHACKYDCILYRKEYKDAKQCPTCGESRYKPDKDNKKTLIPNKVLRHFPLVPRLKRLFSSKHFAADLRWHKEKRVDEPGVLRHPADGEGWKHLDLQFPDFASESRNVRFGLSSDGFNPYGHMSTTYSMWHVQLVPYNLPPWKCMKESNFILSLLIPGPKSPGKEIDVYLQPLIDELKELWSHGVRTYDSFKNEYFQLRACLLWTINDFPAYGDLSGWSTKGYQACPICKEQTSSVGLIGKRGYTSHRRYLPNNHSWRRSKLFNGNTERREPPMTWDGEEILHQVSHMSFPVFSKHPSKQDKKRKQTENNWRKKSIFFELPYWSKLLLRHKLDVMHIEKNVCENLLGTILNIEGKTKDTQNARRDLENLGYLRPELFLQRIGDKWFKPHATYTLTKDERVQFCNFLKSVKYPDGFVSNIGRCVNDSKISGLKTHDCHVLLQRLIPIGVRGFLPKDVYTTIVEFCHFFSSLCCKTLRMDDLDRLQNDIIIILCKMEKIFPPAFFDVMVHLAVHLPYECKVVGPVNYSWMYPFERSLKTFKMFVMNKARPEGSIAEKYVNNECLNFCSLYLTGIETRFNRPERNEDQNPNNECFGVYEVFKQKARPMGEMTPTHLSLIEMRKIHWYVLNNCEEIRTYLTQHLRLIRPGVPSSRDLHKKHEQEFPDWFKKEVLKLRQNGNNCSDLYAIAMGPDSLARSYEKCIVNRCKFHTLKIEEKRATQNSGVKVCGEGGTEDDPMNYYGVLKEVLDVSYVNRRRVMIFKCDWYNTDNKKGRSHFDLGLRSINTSQFWYKDEPYILSTQAQQVFYISDPKYGQNWKVVQSVPNKKLWDVPEVEEEDNEELDVIQLEGPLRVDETIEEDVLQIRTDVEPSIVDEPQIRRPSSNDLDDFIDDDEVEDDHDGSSEGESFDDNNSDE